MEERNLRVACPYCLHEDTYALIGDSEVVICEDCEKDFVVDSRVKITVSVRKIVGE